MWSPDGKYLAYTSSSAGKYNNLIQDLSKRENPRQVLTWPRHGQVGDWSPDGRKFYFYAPNYKRHNPPLYLNYRLVSET